MVVNAAADTRRRTRPGLTLAVVCAAIVLVPVTATGAAVALPDVSAGLGTSLTSAQWVVNAFFLTFASFMAISGSLADLTGRRRMFAGGLALFCAAMLVAAFAPSIFVLIAARVIAGIGAACATTGGSALLAHAFEGPARTKAFGVFGTAIGLGLAFGPLIAGVLVTSLGGWRVFFLVAAVVLLPLLALVPLLTESKNAHPDGADWAGAVTFTLGLSLFVLSLVEGPSLGWGSPLVVGSFAAFVVLLVVFVVIERRKGHPMIDVSLFAEPRFLAICAMPVLLAIGFVALLMSLPAYFMAVDGMSAQSAGLLLVLLTGPTLVAPVLVSSIAHRVPQVVLLVVIMALVAAGAAWLTVIHPGSTSGELAGPLLLIGSGFGVSLAILDGAAVSSVESARAGMAAGVFNTMRLGGESVSIAILGSLLTAVTQSHLTGALGAGEASAVTAQMLQGDMASAVAAGTGPAESLRRTAAEAYTEAMHVGLWAIAAISVLGAVMVGLLARDRTVPVELRSVEELTNQSAG
ncbi:MFS transporter [Amycolatopsis sp. H20-H5]|uniref:MFS transporter n=1 Tax=Amycolatopsis sp. H20-H5 TaxID=3046309 RepID=UPI002DBF1629|nr:MFS transporter [Amycolatopsis sp. H20-H5]MEC3977378.1 MFS transporter [Amycolatopsis sp. H20-H5]